MRSYSIDAYIQLEGLRSELLERAPLSALPTEVVEKAGVKPRGD